MNDSMNNLPLRDIELPEAISWWPLAPGWWLLLMIIIGLSLLALYCLRKQREKKQALLPHALQQLDAIENQFKQHRNTNELLQQVSMLLKQVAVEIEKPKQIARLSGQDWLLYLDQKMEGQPFSTGLGQILLYGPYQQRMNSKQDEQGQLIQLARQWLRTCLHD